jgi:cytochrome c peroxidase
VNRIKYLVIRRVLFCFSILSFSGLIIFYGCEKEPVVPSSHQTIPFIFPDLAQFPQHLNIPENNLTTEEGVKLGRYLFYDGRLSGRMEADSLMSCGSCHVQSRGFECGSDNPRFKGGWPHGLPSTEFPEGKATHHVMLSLVNAVYNSNGYLWNGMLEDSNEKSGPEGYSFMGDDHLNFKYLESIVWMTITAPDEINGSVDKTVDLIASLPLYPPMFKDAFGTDEVNIDRISKAIAQFVRTIIACSFKFYQYVDHKAELSSAELHGYQMFYSEKADCFHCHAGSLLMTTTGYFNNAKDTVFDDPADRYSVTGNLTDKGAYFAPSLINCEVTAPYMHDGRFKTLDEVIDFYSEGLKYSDYVSPLMTYVQFGGNHLTSSEKADLKAFLLTLTDHDMLTDPAYSCPDDLGAFGMKDPFTRGN